MTCPRPGPKFALTHVLGSGTFAHSARLSRFLRFAAHEVLAGHGDRLKEYVLAVEVFDRPASFDSATDSVVRVEARRLRAKLATFYETEGLDEQVVIELPKGTYAPRFRSRATSPGAAAPDSSREAAFPATAGAPAVIGRGARRVGTGAPATGAGWRSRWRRS